MAQLSLSLVLRELQANNCKINGSVAGNLVGALVLIAAGVLPPEPGVRAAYLGFGAYLALCSRASVDSVKRLFILLEEVEGRSYEQAGAAIASEFAAVREPVAVAAIAPAPAATLPSEQLQYQPSGEIAAGGTLDWQLLNSNISEPAGMALSQRLKFFDWTLFNSDPNKWPHLAIVGGTGDGKSFTAERLIPVLDGYPLISHPHWKPADYPDPGYCAVYCGGRNYGDWEDDDSVNFESLFDGRAGKVSFASFMKTLEIEMDRRYKCYERGDEGYPMINVVLDELNTSLSKVPDAVESLKNLLREARKVKIRLICLLQSDNVKSLKMEGEGVLRYCWRYIRLGEFAASHARKSRDADLIEWVANRRFPILVESMPAMLPSAVGRVFSSPDTSGLARTSQDVKFSEAEIEQVLEWLGGQNQLITASDLVKGFPRLNQKTACFLIERASEERLGKVGGEFPDLMFFPSGSSNPFCASEDAIASDSKISYHLPHKADADLVSESPVSRYFPESTESDLWQRILDTDTGAMSASDLIKYALKCTKSKGSNRAYSEVGIPTFIYLLRKYGNIEMIVRFARFLESQSNG